MHPNSLKNLEKGKKFQRTADEQTISEKREAGKKSGEVRRMKKTFQQLAEFVGMKKPIPEIIKYLEEQGFNLETSNDLALVVKQYEKAIQDGDTRAAEFVYKLSGEEVMRVKHEVSTSLTDWKELIKKALSES